MSAPRASRFAPANWRISVKILCLVLALLSTTLVVAGAGLWGQSALERAILRLDEVATEVRIGARMNQNLLDLRRVEYRVAAEPAFAEEGRRQIAAIAAAFRDRDRRLRGMYEGTRAAELDAATEEFDAYLAEVEKTIALSVGSDPADDAARAAILASIHDHRALAEALRGGLEDFVMVSDGEGDAAAVAARETSHFAYSLILGIAGAALIGGLLVGWAIARFGLVKPLEKSIASLKSLAAGKLDTQIFGLGRGDEIGIIAAAMEVFKTEAAEAERLRGAQDAKEAEQAETRRRELDELARKFEEQVGQIAKSIGSTVTELEGTAQSMSSIAEETASRAVAVSAAAEQSSGSVETVASASEELSASIQEINGQVSQSADLARDAVREAEGTGERVRALAEAAEQIGSVIQLIQAIAEQTNLLALNATIEAARAGDAGKGFAVVAGEVKDLASQTAKATEEISSRIRAVQKETEVAVGAIEAISGKVRSIDEVSAAIAAAVEQQGGATSEIARNVQEAARGTQQVTGNIGGVTEASRETGTAASQMAEAVRELTRQSRRLEEAAGGFIEEVRAA